MRTPRSLPLLTVVGVALVSLLPVFAFGIVRSQSRARGDIERNFRERARIGAQLSQSLFSSSFQAAQALNAKLYGSARVTSRMLDLTVRSAGLSYSVLLGPDGHVIAASSLAPPRAQWDVEGGSGPIHRVLAGQSFFVGDQLRLSPHVSVVQSAQSFRTRFGRRVLVTATPARLMYRFLGGYIRDLPTTDRGRGYVVDSDGVVLGSTSTSVSTGRPLSERPLLGAIARRSYGLFGPERYFASYPVGGSSWRVVLTAPGGALFGSVNAVTQWRPWVVFGAFALAVLLTLSLLRRVAVTNRRLVGANQELERNVTELHDSQERLAHDALHDMLTGLPNRTLFNDRLAQALARGARLAGYRCAVLFVDLDRFKVVNDGFNHAAGDELLVSLARRLDAGLRPGDTVARFGGDEFTLLLDDVGSAEEALMIAHRQQAELERPFQLGERKLFVTASIGIAVSEPGANVDELLRNADIAMYHAKAQGAGKVAEFNANMHTRVVRKVKLETELREAIERDLLRVFYQPIVDLNSGRVSGIEALARWPEESPTINPSEFITVAEETGLIGPLGELVLDEACTRLSDWRRRGLVEDDVPVSVNVSARQFGEELAAVVTAALTRTGLPPHALRLEITETTIMNAPEQVNALLAELERTGVRAQIDDFGTGYSSLSFLHGFPGDALKIDRSFVASLHKNEDSEAIVGGIIALAHNVNLHVIAEGVDHPAQISKLRNLGCEHAQGFLLCKPVPANLLEELLKSWDANVIVDIASPPPKSPASR